MFSPLNVMIIFIISSLSTFATAEEEKCINTFSRTQVNHTFLSSIFGKSITLPDGSSLKKANGKTRKYTFTEQPDIENTVSFGSDNFFLLPIKNLSRKITSYDLLHKINETLTVIGQQIRTPKMPEANIEFFADGTAVILETPVRGKLPSQIILAGNKIVRLRDAEKTNLNHSKMILANQNKIKRQTIRQNGYELIILDVTKSMLHPTTSSKSEISSLSYYDPIDMPYRSSNIIVLLKKMSSDKLIDIESIEVKHTQNPITITSSEDGLVSIKEIRHHGSIINTNINLHRIQKRLQNDLTLETEAIKSGKLTAEDSKNFILKSPESKNHYHLRVEKFLLKQENNKRTYGFYITQSKTYSGKILDEVFMKQIVSHGETDIKVSTDNRVSITNSEDSSKDVDISILKDKIILMAE